MVVFDLNLDFKIVFLEIDTNKSTGKVLYYFFNIVPSEAMLSDSGFEVHKRTLICNFGIQFVQTSKTFKLNSLFERNGV